MNGRRRMRRVVLFSVLLLVLTGSFAHFHTAQNASAPSLASVLPLIKAQDKAQTERPGTDELPTVGERSFSGSGTRDPAIGGSSNGGSSDEGPDDESDDEGSGDEGTGKDPDPPMLSVSVGDIDILYPGMARSVPLTIGNPFGFDIVLNRVTVSSTGTQACPASFLSLGTYDVAGPRIGAMSTTPAMTTVALKASAPDSCQGARYRIRVKVEAGRV